MAKRFRVTVNGQAYEVEVEEVGRPETASAGMPAPESMAARPAPVAATAPIARPEPKPIVAAQAPAPKLRPASASPRPSGPAAPAGKGVITAPIPGVISQVKVHPGQAVKTREVLMLLEAMKMQNEILAAHPGTVREVYVSNGATVNTGDKLVAIDPE